MTFSILLSTVSAPEAVCGRAGECSHLNTPSLWFNCAGEPFNNCAILDDYSIEKEPIGVGGFGTVHLGTHRETKKTFAVKYMDITSTCKFNCRSGSAEFLVYGITINTTLYSNGLFLVPNSEQR